MKKSNRNSKGVKLIPDWVEQGRNLVTGKTVGAPVNPKSDKALLNKYWMQSS